MEASVNDSAAPIAVTAFWSGSARELIATPRQQVVAELARYQVRHFRTTEAEQSPAWDDSVAALQSALAALGSMAAAWHVLFEYPMLRLGMRIDAVLLTDRAILVLEFKRAQADLAALRQVEDYALNLRDFHDGSRAHPIVPILVSGEANEARNQAALFWDVVPSVPQQARPENLGAFIAELMVHIGRPTSVLNPARWLAGAYRPVPTIIEAARMVYAKHGVAEIAAARADQKNLHATTHAIWDAIRIARTTGAKLLLFVTGIPGAGKTLCGLNIAFGGDDPDGTFLTGNPTLVHVLREALVRDAVDQGTSRRGAERRMLSKIQALPHFRNDNLLRPDRPPPERIAVIDEAQRCWSRDYAVRKTVGKQPPLTDSEPGHLLDIFGRHDGFAAIVCLVGSGQEIHDGEGGLAEWGAALTGRPHWQVAAPPDVLEAGDPRRQLGNVSNLLRNPLLHLDVAVRQIRNVDAVAWVDALLAGSTEEARTIAERCGELPFLLTRDLESARFGARALARGNRRAGMLASSGGRRLRAEGLGAELPHMDASAVAYWFLNIFPRDVRASNALEQVATEFSCQGLELDVTLLCWDADLIPVANVVGWVPRNFRGTRWQAVHGVEAAANQLNTYRVLLTRARYETIIFVPRGDAGDPTRDPAVYDRIAARMHEAGAPWLEESVLPSVPAADPERMLL